MTAEAFRATLPGVSLVEEPTMLDRQPLCVVELDHGPDIAPSMTFLPCVVVGVWAGSTEGITPHGADILLTDDPEATRPWVTCADLSSGIEVLSAACTRNPVASVALAQLIRLGPDLPVPDALVAESFVYSMLQAGPEYGSWLARRRTRSAPSSDGEPVGIVRDGDVLSIRLQRPAVHNAYNAAMRDGLVTALQVAVLDPTVRQVCVTGMGPSFCSGGDLSEFGTASDPATAHSVRIRRGAAIWMDRCSARTSVYVHGSCIGAGVELAAFAHRVVADPGSTFRLPEVAMGLVPGAGGTASVPRRIGRQRAAYLAISGETIGSATAADWGLVDEIGARDPGSLPGPGFDPV
jgi:enoyl-CoA hydratase/carnithine racemase